MIFTREDILKILNALLQLGRKDSEFKDADTPLNSEDYISILQDGINKKVSINNLLSTLGLLKKDDFINVSDRYDEYYIQLSEAITIIAKNKRKKGLVITFQDLKGDWKVYQFKGVLNQWNQLDLWEDLFDWGRFVIDSILPDEEDLTKSLPDENGNSHLSLKDRVYGDGMGYVILRKNKSFAEQVTLSNTIYEIRYEFNLNNTEVTIPKSCILKFEGGIISNGIIKGNNLYFSGDYFDKLNVVIDGTVSNKDFIVSQSTDEVNKSKIEAARNDIVIKGEVTLSSETNLYCNLKGYNNDSSIVVAGNCKHALQIVVPGVSIINLKIVKELPERGTVPKAHIYRYAVYSTKGNLTISNCEIHGAIGIINNDKTSALENIYISNNRIFADFTKIPDDQNIEIKDVFLFYGCSNVYVSCNKIEAKNVLRVFKTTAIIGDSYDEQYQNPTNIVIESNEINAVSTDGKQIWDMYCGTKLVCFSKNKIYTRGHTCIFENKTVQSNGVPVNLNFTYNEIDADCQITFASMTNIDTIKFANNVFIITEYKFNTQPINILGCDVILFNNEITFSGLNYNFIGLSSQGSMPINKAEIRNNKFKGTKRISVFGCKHLEYLDNDVDNLEQEIDVNSDIETWINVRKTICKHTNLPVFIVQNTTFNVHVNVDMRNISQMFSRVSSNDDDAKKRWINSIISTIPIYATSDSNAQYFLAESYVNYTDVSNIIAISNGIGCTYIRSLGYPIFWAQYTSSNKGWKTPDGHAMCPRQGKTSDREALILTPSDEGTLYFDSQADKLFVWSGYAWKLVNVE